MTSQGESRLARILSDAIALAVDQAPGGTLVSKDSSIAEVEAELSSRGGKVARMLAEAALISFRTELVDGSRTTRNGLTFLVSDKRPHDELVFTEKSTVKWHLNPEIVKKAIANANKTIELIHDVAASNRAPIFELLGLRNLSSFTGEIFAGALNDLYSDRFLRNPNQDGHPDLMALTPEGDQYVREHTRNNVLDRDKRHWSPFPFGGVEVKATCGNTPDAGRVAKPQIGDARIPILESAEWKAHHRETNNLLGLFWDFVDGLPTLLAAFFRNDLTPVDWGNVVRPRGTSRTTSVSIMTRKGVCKMGAGWIVLPKEQSFLRPLMSKRVFGVTSEILARSCSDPQVHDGLF